MARCNGEFTVTSIRATRLELIDGQKKTLKDIVLVPVAGDDPASMPQNLQINNLVDDDVQLGDRFLIQISPLKTMGDVLRAAFPDREPREL